MELYLRPIQPIALSVETRNQVDVIFTDLREAFYSINHGVKFTMNLREISLYEIENPLLFWLKLYLPN